MEFGINLSHFDQKLRRIQQSKDIIKEFKKDESCNVMMKRSVFYMIQKPSRRGRVEFTRRTKSRKSYLEKSKLKTMLMNDERIRSTGPIRQCKCSILVF